MATFLDYARDEVRTFAEQPFCGEDALIFSQLVYLSFPDALATKSLTLQQLLRRETYPALIDEMSHGQEALELLRLCGESPRFRDVRLADRISPNSTADPNRFCAATFILPDSTRVIAFRGTDGTIAGWHEDYRLLFVTPPLDSQARALAYLKSHTSAHLAERPEIIITGHSMGGNLAIYAAAVAPHSVQSRIRAVYAQDSPGFIRSFIESKQFQAIRSRVHKYVPESSMVGMLFDSGVEETVVRSNAHGSEQHFLSTWLFTHPQIEQEASGEEQKPALKSTSEKSHEQAPETSLKPASEQSQEQAHKPAHEPALKPSNEPVAVTASAPQPSDLWVLDRTEHLSRYSQALANTLNGWRESLDVAQRERFIETLFSALDSTGYVQFSQLRENWNTVIPVISQYLRSLPATERNQLSSAIGELVKLIVLPSGEENS